MKSTLQLVTKTPLGLEEDGRGSLCVPVLFAHTRSSHSVRKAGAQDVEEATNQALPFPPHQQR